MTTSVKERLKAELEQAQVEGKQRASRIGDILKAAASMTLDEIKAGSSELNTATRKSVAEILEDLKEAPNANADTSDEVTVADPAVVTDPAVAAEPDPANVGDVAPTWQSIIRNALAIVRDRKGDWFSAFKKSLNNNAVKMDQDLSVEYGERYLKVRNFFRGLVEQLQSQSTAAPTATTTDHQPVTIEVVDGDDVVVNVTPKVQILASEEER